MRKGNKVKGEHGSGIIHKLGVDRGGKKYVVIHIPKHMGTTKISYYSQNYEDQPIKLIN